MSVMVRNNMRAGTALVFVMGIVVSWMLAFFWVANRIQDGEVKRVERALHGRGE